LGLGEGVEDEPRLFCAFELRLSTINLRGLLRFWALLELYVSRDRCGDHSLLIVRDFDREHEQSSAGPNRARLSRKATCGNGPQIVDGEIGRRDAFVRFKLRDHGKRGGAID